MNNTVFETKGNEVTVRNAAGGVAYKMSTEAALAQLASTGTFSNTYYATAQDQLDTVKELCKEVSPEFLAKLAVYSRESAYMKDMSAFLLGMLMVKDLDLFKKVFNRVVDNGKMLKNFVQVVRSGQVGRKSFGSAPKKMIRQWLENRKDHQLLDDSIGNDPSLKDVIKMVHPRPANPNREAFYAYLIDKEVSNIELLPESVRAFESFKKAPKGCREVPKVNFQLLTAQDLSNEEWTALAKTMSWHTLRMNVNTLQRHGVFSDKEMVTKVAEKLADEKAIKASKVFPYQLFTTAINVGPETPVEIAAALNRAMEIATTNVSGLNGRVVVAVDCSGSMDCPVLGTRPGVMTKTTCRNVAALLAACVLRNSENVDVLRFTTSSERINLKKSDSIVANTQKIGNISGGTTISSPVAQLNAENANADLVIIVSDNESWADARYGSGTALDHEWKKFKARNPNAKLVCIDLAPNRTTQVTNSTDRLNVGGFSDNVFDVIRSFAEGTTSDAWVQKINSVTI